MNPGTAPERYTANPLALAAAFERCAARWVDQPAFYVGVTPISYGELARQSRELRRAFIDLGVGPGDRVAILAPLRVEWVVSALATYGLGADFLVLDAAAPAELSSAKVFLFDAAVVLASDTFPEPAASTHVVDLDGVLDGDDATSYRGLIARGRRDPMPPRPHASVAAMARPIPLSLSDRVVTGTDPTHAELSVWLPLLSGAAIAPTDDLLATCALIRPSVIVVTPSEATHLTEAMFAAVEAPYAALFSLKLDAARRRRALHAAGRRSTLLNLGHLLVDRVAGRHARAIFGHHLRLVASTGPLPAATRDTLELVGLSTFDLGSLMI